MKSASELLEQEVAKLEEAHAAKTTALDREIERKDKFIQDLLRKRAVRSAVAQSRCQAKFRDAVEALLLERLSLRVENADGEHRVIVMTDFGEASLDHAVANFLEGAGKAFTDQAPTEEPHFLSQLRRLNDQSLH
jgi:hypothetical protein